MNRCAPFLALILTFGLLPTIAEGQGIYIEGADAGGLTDPDSTLSAANVFSSSLVEIQGSLGGADLVDAYCIVVDDPATFYATTNSSDDPGAGSTFDSRLLLFTAFSDPISGNDDSPSGGTGAFLSSAATFPGSLASSPGSPDAGLSYILAVTAFPLEAWDITGNPIFNLGAAANSLVGPNPMAGVAHQWQPATLFLGSYTIRLAGASACGPNDVFLTSETGTGDLSTWPSAFGQTGLDAADTICQLRAFSTGRPYTADFVAWMSDSQDDAYCRLFGLTGKKSANCGQGSLPGAIGPFVTTGGKLFSRSIEDLVAGRIYNPVRNDEFGALLTDEIFFTATDRAGALYSADTCTDWTSNSGSSTTRAGSSEGTTNIWTERSLVSCAAPQRILCMRTRNSPRPTPPRPGRLAFLTSAKNDGNLSTWPQAGGAMGRAAGDAICQNLATSAGLQQASLFKAWLSTSTSAAKDGLIHDGPWYRLDGALLATSKAELTSGRLQTSLNVDETGAHVTTFLSAWTGTSAAGTFAGESCSDWTSFDSSLRGVPGRAAFADSPWTESNLTQCNSSSLRLYCFSNARATIFADGFESGDIRGWDRAVACGAGCP